MGNTKAKGWNFTQIPIWVVCDSELSDGAKMLFAYLKWRQGKDAACWPSKATMARDLGVSKDTITRRLHELVEQGYVARRLRPGRTTLYELIADPGNRRQAWEEREAGCSQGEATSSEVEGSSRESEEERTPPQKCRGVGEDPPAKMQGDPPANLQGGPPRKNAPHDDNHERESCNDKQIGAGSTAPPPCFPDLFDTPIPEIKAREFTRAEWEAILEAEQARGDGKRGERTRVTLVRWLEKKLYGAQHPAIRVYHEEMGRFPRKNQFDAVIERVGVSHLDFWREVVKAWKLHGWNPYNLAGMLECYEENRIPSTGGHNESTGGNGHGDGRYTEEDVRAANEAAERELQNLSPEERRYLEAA